MGTNIAPTSRPKARWWLVCGGCAGLSILACCGLLGAGALLRSLRPDAKELYAAAPDIAAGEDVSQALIDSGVEGASVVVIPIKGSPGQIAILTLDESRGYRGFTAAGSENLRVVVTNIVNANRAGDYHIEQLSIDYRDSSGQSSLAFTTTMAQAEAYVDGSVSEQEFMGQVDFNLVETLRYLGVDEILQEGKP